MYLLLTHCGNVNSLSQPKKINLNSEMTAAACIAITEIIDAALTTIGHLKKRWTLERIAVANSARIIQLQRKKRDQTTWYTDEGTVQRYHDFLIVEFCTWIYSDCCIDNQLFETRLLHA